MNRRNCRLSIGTLIAAFAALLLAAQTPAVGQVIYSTGFENPPFARGSGLVGQDGWITPPPFSPGAAVIVTEMSIEGRQTVRVRGGDLVPQDFIDEGTEGYYGPIGSYRHPVNHETGGTQVVRVSADVRVNGPGTEDGDDFFSAAVAAVTADGDEVGEMKISSDGHVYAYSGNGFVPTFLTSAPITLGEWHNLTVEVDFLNQTSAFFVDGEHLGTFDWDEEIIDKDPTILVRGSLIVYGAPDTQTRRKQNYMAHFDNFVIEAVAD